MSDGAAAKRVVTVVLSAGFTQSLPEDLADVESVVLEVGDEEPLQGVFDRAQAALGRTVPPPSDDPNLGNADRELTLSTEPDENGRRVARPVPGALVASDGRLKWGHFNLDFGAVTIGDLRRSRQLGLIDADPSALVFAAKDPIGNGAFLAWNELQNILITVGAVGGGVTFLGTTTSRLRRAIGKLRRTKRGKGIQRSVSTDYDSSSAWLADFFDRNHPRWVARGANQAADFVMEVCRHEQWDAPTLAQVLQIELKEAQTLLGILGYDYNDSSRRHELSTKSERKVIRTRLLRKTIRYDPATGEILMDDEA